MFDWIQDALNWLAQFLYDLISPWICWILNFFYDLMADSITLAFSLIPDAIAQEFDAALLLATDLFNFADFYFPVSEAFFLGSAYTGFSFAFMVFLYVWKLIPGTG